MNGRMFGFLIAVCCLTISGSVRNVEAHQRCAKAIERIMAAEERGDLAVAKLLVDYVTDDNCDIGCTDEQLSVLTEIREDIYSAYIADRVRITKEGILGHNNGNATLRSLLEAANAADALGSGLKDLETLYAAALFTAASQSLNEAKEADWEGDIDSRDRLRAQAAQLISKALTLDTRVVSMVKTVLGP